MGLSCTASSLLRTLGTVVPDDPKYLEGLEVKNGCIVTRGAFYLERRYVPYFSSRADRNSYCYRETDCCNDIWYVFRVTDAERKVFPELREVATVAVRREGSMVLSWIRSCTWRKP